MGEGAAIGHAGPNGPATIGWSGATWVHSGPPLAHLGAMRGTALAAHKEEVRTGGCAEHNRFAPAGLKLFYQCWLDRSLGGVGDMRNPPCFVAGEEVRR